jgi:putative redox protein
MEKPPVAASLVWEGDQRFRASSGAAQLVLDGSGTAGLSPVEAAAVSLAGCMGIDVVDILRKGRHAVDAFGLKVVGSRAETHPRRFIRIELHFEIRGNPPAHAVERAIELSRERYCSVWQSMRQDIELVTTIEVNT